MPARSPQTPDDVVDLFAGDQSGQPTDVIEVTSFTTADYPSDEPAPDTKRLDLAGCAATDRRPTVLASLRGDSYLQAPTTAGAGVAELGRSPGLMRGTLAGRVAARGAG